jgi:hypothetical protein
VFVTRLAEKLASDGSAAVFIHEDRKSGESGLRERVQGLGDIVYCEDREAVHWSGYSSVRAVMKLLRIVVGEGGFDRIVMLQGADYPWYSNRRLREFFERHREVEFIRACRISDAPEPYFSRKIRQVWRYDHPGLGMRIWHKWNRMMPIPVRAGHVTEGGVRHDVYFGTAQWAITGACARHVLEFADSHPRFCRFFESVHCADELFFHSVVHGSEFGGRTEKGGAEPRVPGIVNWRNLHYFEYGSKIRVFRADDLPVLEAADCPFFRKATSGESGELLDRIDEMHAKEREALPAA